MSIRTILTAVLLLASSGAFANPSLAYEVTITNITKGQFFTPVLVATHDRSVRLFSLGSPASTELEILAEGGDTTPLANALINQSPRVGNVRTIPGLLGPGQSATVTVEASRFHQFVSVAAMLIPTNDTFVAINRARLPFFGSRTFMAKAYDSGTEANDQNCVSIPGPRCGGAGYSPGPNAGDEGFVYIGNGFHEIGAEDESGNEVLGPLNYDWRNPVARITVRRL